MLPITKLNDFKVDLSGLDNTQKAAVVSEAENILVRAPAGSGKTTCILSAVANYRYEHLNDRICAITFTRAATEEMKTRLEQMGIHDVAVSTIHSWAREQLLIFARKYDFKVDIIHETEIRAILQVLIQDYLETHPKIRGVNLDILYNFVSGNKNMDVKDSFKRTLCALENRYIRYKRENHLYDFTDYPLYLFDVMNTFDETINSIDALFVDEYQDVDSTQFELFKKVNASKKFFCGDGWQSIYAFRGADGEAFNKTADFEQFKLSYNYRSYQEIIDYAVTVYLAQKEKAALEENCYITEVMWTGPSDIKCSRGHGGTVVVANPFGRVIKITQDGVSRVASLVNEFKEIMSDRPMILCRTNRQVKTINEAGYFEASTIHQAKGLEYTNVVVIDTTISCTEDLNIAYVALTRARDKMLVINWNQFELLFNMYMR